MIETRTLIPARWSRTLEALNFIVAEFHAGSGSFLGGLRPAHHRQGGLISTITTLEDRDAESFAPWIGLAGEVKSAWPMPSTADAEASESARGCYA